MSTQNSAFDWVMERVAFGEIPKDIEEVLVAALSQPIEPQGAVVGEAVGSDGDPAMTPATPAGKGNSDE